MYFSERGSRMALRTLCLTAALCLSAPALLLAQPPAGAPPAGAPPAGARPGGGGGRAPQNLKVLPADTNIFQTMMGFRQALGVGCEFCHAQNPDTHRNDFASDANPMKETARAMIRMNMDINEKYLANLPNMTDKPTITCGTCHQGNKIPAAFTPPAGNGPGGPPPAGAPAPRPGM
jgi:hypothetical protein